MFSVLLFSGYFTSVVAIIVDLKVLKLEILPSILETRISIIPRIERKLKKKKRKKEKCSLDSYCSLIYVPLVLSSGHPRKQIIVFFSSLLARHV